MLIIAWTNMMILLSMSWNTIAKNNLIRLTKWAEWCRWKIKELWRRRFVTRNNKNNLKFALTTSFPLSQTSLLSWRIIEFSQKHFAILFASDAWTFLISAGSRFVFHIIFTRSTKPFHWNEFTAPWNCWQKKGLVQDDSSKMVMWSQKQITRKTNRRQMQSSKDDMTQISHVCCFLRCDGESSTDQSAWTERTTLNDHLHHWMNCVGCLSKHQFQLKHLPKRTSLQFWKKSRLPHF